MPKSARKVKAYLIIKDHVQDVGYRVWIMERLLETNLKGGPINQPDGSIKVLLEGTKKEILDFVKRLKDEKPELAENPVMVGPNFVNDLAVPDAMQLTHALQMNQFGRAIIYLANMKEDINRGFSNVNSNVNNGFTMLSDRIFQVMLIYPIITLIVVFVILKLLNVLN